ncbi:hypothetical protein CC2G_006067 [Coprinopsis cinerea AmutBmut pab1-1]|nr:hypothetical protein CC2G_006067 [Coprinopsis cinerea AmutBmut pab1-1]
MESSDSRTRTLEDLHNLQQRSTATPKYTARTSVMVTNGNPSIQHGDHVNAANSSLVGHRPFCKWIQHGSDRECHLANNAPVSLRDASPSTFKFSLFVQVCRRRKHMLFDGKEPLSR